MFKKFTLIELLLVISIISVLMSFILPSISKARAKIKESVCLSNSRQIMLATIPYINDNNQFGPRDDVFIQKKRWFNRLKEYLPPREGKKKANLVHQCPVGMKLNAKSHSNIGINIRISGKNNEDAYVKQRSLSQASSTTCLFMDSRGRSRFVRPGLMKLEKLIEGRKDKRMSRHLNRSNIMYLDGSGKSVKFTFLLLKTNWSFTFWDPEA